MNKNIAPIFIAFIVLSIAITPLNKKMILIENGYVQDGLKAVIYFIPLIYIILKKKSLNLKYFWLFFTGLSLLAFGNLLDFIDEFEFLKGLDFTLKYALLQDFFEDIVGLALGFAVLMIALFLEFRDKNILKR